MAKPAKLTVEKWGDGVAVPIPAEIAQIAHLIAGQSVEVTICGETVSLRPLPGKLPSLEERLAEFDPDAHGGEVMAARPVGRERL